MTTVLQGNFIYAPEWGKLEAVPRGYLVLEDGAIQGLYPILPERYTACPAEDWGDALIMPSFADMHLHAPQYPMLGMGMDLPLLEWLDAYTFRTEARFSDTAYARQVYRQLAEDLITSGTTRVCAFSSRHTDATLILMDELERAGVTGYVGKVNMDRHSGPAQESTDESIRETLRWLDGCRFAHVKPILTPRFTPSCTQYWETYGKYGLWKDGALMAHCVYSGPEERAAMARAGVWAVHCAASNMNLCSGTAPVRTLVEEGVTVALGSDIAGGDQLAMSKVIVMSIRASKVRQMETGEPFLTVPEAYYLGSTAGHRYFGGGAGFQAGCKLHAIVVDDSAMPAPARSLSLAERFERAVYLMDKRHIQAVYSEGRKVHTLQQGAGLGSQNS